MREIIKFKEMKGKNQILYMITVQNINTRTELLYVKNKMVVETHSTSKITDTSKAV